MKHFERLRLGIDPRPFLEEIEGVDGAWDSATGRQEKIAVQREALAIPLRGLRKSMINGRKRRDVHESRWTSGSERFPVARAVLEQIATEERAELGRAKIVCLKAGRRVYPHIDRGEYYRVRGRYHFVLRSSAGSWMRAGDEETRMQEGELWWFDNNAVHEAHNDGDQDRVHMIFDMLPLAMREEVYAEVREAS
ncbi:MAG: aspartyl/asparaginyl beta-hydroxylase domain-containing protein [Pseudomonadota bacterium]